MPIRARSEKARGSQASHDASEAPDSHIQLKESLRGQSLASQLQLLSPVQAHGGDASGSVHQAAAVGVSGSSSSLPHLDTIQKSFGSHDVSSVQAHTDSAAKAGTQAMGASAFASGNHVAFGSSSPDLHTAAHEAAHVVQQRGGVQLKGGVGKAGDSYEQHADRVADAVVAGKSAEGLLDQMAPSTSGGGIQQKVVQRKEDEPSEESGESPPPGLPPPPPDLDEVVDESMDPGLLEIEDQASELADGIEDIQGVLFSPEIAEAFLHFNPPEPEPAPKPKLSFGDKLKKKFWFKSKAKEKYAGKVAKDVLGTYPTYAAAYAPTLAKVGAEGTKYGAKGVEWGAGVVGAGGVASSAGEVAKTAGQVSGLATGVGIGVTAIDTMWQTRQAVRTGKMAKKLGDIGDEAITHGDVGVGLAAKYAMRKKRKKAIKRTLQAVAGVTSLIGTGFLLASNPVGWAFAAAGLGIALGVFGHKMYRKWLKNKKGTKGKNRRHFAEQLTKGLQQGNPYAIKAVDAMGLDARAYVEELQSTDSDVQESAYQATIDMLFRKMLSY